MPGYSVVSMCYAENRPYFWVLLSSFSMIPCALIIEGSTEQRAPLSTVLSVSTRQTVVSPHAAVQGYVLGGKSWVTGAKLSLGDLSLRRVLVIKTFKIDVVKGSKIWFISVMI